MSDQQRAFLERFFDHPIPVIVVGFYMYWMSRVIQWGMSPAAGENAEWLVAAVTLPGAAFFKFYVDLIIGDKK